ncbi:hypothetical protein M885DRAFT_524508 [Pelagophyceae sp. CCMP2097]|nr:hypothetical protein M885DRAFT_524508 [Pelagophyceae sp. CCMP2097]
MRPLDYVVVLLQLYFMLMNVTVERSYCKGEFRDDDLRFLVQETIDFCQRFNPLFLSRPPWMVAATCVSAYGYFPFYALISYAAVTDKWGKLSVPILLFLGAKLNALSFYHLMEFSSTTPPEHLLEYFAVEGPYLFSIALCLQRCINARAKIKGQ